MDAVAPGLGAQIDDWETDTFCFRIEDLVGIGEADRHGIDQDIAIIAGMEIHFTAKRRDAEGIAIAANAGDDARDQMAGLRMIRAAEAQRIECRDRTRSHGEDIAQYAADAGCRPLIGFDERGVVVALHLEDDGLAVADIDDAGIFARALDDFRT